MSGKCKDIINEISGAITRFEIYQEDNSLVIIHYCNYKPIFYSYSTEALNWYLIKRIEDEYLGKHFKDKLKLIEWKSKSIKDKNCKLLWDSSKCDLDSLRHSKQ